MNLRTEDGNLDWKKIGYRARSFFAVTLSLLIVVGGGYFVFSKVHDVYMDWRTAEDYIGEGKDAVVVTIPSGTSVSQIGEILVDANVVRSTKAFNEAVDDEPDAKNIQAGQWALKTELPAATALAMLLDNSNRVAKKVTIVEGLRKEQQWAALSKTLDIPVEDFESAAKKDDYGLPDWAKGNPEGLLFPDTYEVSDDPSPKQIMKMQVAEFNKVAEDMDLEARAKKLGYSPLDIVTVASITQREVGSEYMPQVAQVIYNRLKAGKALEFNTTVQYALNDYSHVTQSDEDLKVDSPYNTYLPKNAGKLPPGPIDSPGKDALEAALSPADTDAMYFVTVNLDTGETLFAKTYEEHLVNVAKYDAWCEANAGKCN